MGKDTNKPVVTKLPLDKALLLINKKITTVPFYNKVHIIKSESQNDDNNSSNDRIPFDSLNTRTTLISNCANLYQIILNEYTNRFNSNNNTEESKNNNGGIHIEAIPMENIPNGEYHGNKLTFNANNGIIELWINNNSFMKIPNLKNKYDNKKGGGKQGKEGQFIKLSKITSNLRHEEFIMKYKIDLKVNNSSSLTNQLIKSEFKYIIELLFDNKDSSVLTFATDKRMSKYKELLHNDKCEAVFYFSRIKKQFRLRARARVIDEQNPPLDLINVLNQEEETERQISTDITQELNRQWSNLSKSLKKSFKKPPPKLVMSDENAKLISSIHRGVDGKNIDYGLKNFALVGLFIDYVDYYDLEKDKRFIYQLDENHQWFEQEVCP